MNRIRCKEHKFIRLGGVSSIYFETNLFGFITMETNIFLMKNEYVLNFTEAADFF